MPAQIFLGVLKLCKSEPVVRGVNQKSQKRGLYVVTHFVHSASLQPNETKNSN
jgi:hypothetical protein